MGETFQNKGNLTITGSAIAVGKNAQASNATGQAVPVSSAEAALRADLARLTARLRAVAEELADGDTVTAAIDEVDEELARPTTTWQRVLDALRRIGPRVAALTRIAADVATIETAVRGMIPL